MFIYISIYLAILSIGLFFILNYLKSKSGWKDIFNFYKYFGPVFLGMITPIITYEITDQINSEKEYEDFKEFSEEELEDNICKLRERNSKGAFSVTHNKSECDRTDEKQIINLALVTVEDQFLKFLITNEYTNKAAKKDLRSLLSMHEQYRTLSTAFFTHDLTNGNASDVSWTLACNISYFENEIYKKSNLLLKREPDCKK